MSSDAPEQENPLNLPLVLLDAVHSSIPDQLEATLHYLDGLPRELKDVFGEHFEIIHIDSLRRIWSGLKKLRENVLPTEDELDVIAHRPSDVFRELAEGLESATESSPIQSEVARFVNDEIVKPLEEVSRTFLPDPADGLVTWWFERLQDDPAGPFTHSRSPEP